jgi:hypothetical protein
MDEREKEVQNGKRKRWGVERKMLFFGIVIFMFFYYQESERSEGK